MKKSFLICILVLLLYGCSDSAVVTPQAEAPQPEETFFRESSADHHDPKWTEQELLTAFYQYAEEDMEVVDCVIIPDSDYGIVGVLTEPLGEETMAYIGNDTVNCILLQEDGTEYTCTISYYEIPENKETGFKVIG